MSTPEHREILMPGRYGFHMPRTHKRDAYYQKLEDERASRAQA